MTMQLKNLSRLSDDSRLAITEQAEQHRRP
jgi:hypothetical protein